MLATEKFTAAKKNSLVAAYRSYTKIFRLPWLPIKVHYEPKQPFIPTHEELTALIHAAHKRLATFLQTLLDTGARCGEVSKLKWTDINTENLTVSINSPEKHSRSRTLKVTQKTIAMLQAMPKKYDPYIFNPNQTTLKAPFMALRDRLAETQKTHVSNKYTCTLSGIFSPVTCSAKPKSSKQFKTLWDIKAASTRKSTLG